MKYKDAAQADIDAGIASTIGEQIPSIYISWGALIQAIIDFLLIALILFLIIKITTAVFNSAKKAKERLLKKEKEVVQQWENKKKNTDAFLSLHIRTQIWSIYL